MKGVCPVSKQLCESMQDRDERDVVFYWVTPCRDNARKRERSAKGARKARDWAHCPSQALAQVCCHPPLLSDVLAGVFFEVVG